jgi:4,5-dihydroxyphthalate decarboxylase
MNHQGRNAMTAGRMDLSIALSDNARTRPIIDGHVEIESVTPYITTVHPSEMFWRQLKYADFDISEMSMSSLLIAAARGDYRWVGIPVFTSRMFFHTRILVRGDRGINVPADLKGKRVAVPEYQQTSAIWSRGILQNEFGVDQRDIEWFMERTPDMSHGGSTGFTPPPGVKLNRIPPTTNIGEMLVKGELDATLLYLTNTNLVDRSTIDIEREPSVRPLFADGAAEGRRYYAKTGIYPINHTVVMRRELYEKHPWIALNLYSAFARAKDKSLKDARKALQPWREVGALGPDAEKGFGADPLAYGVKAPRATLEMIAQFLQEQGLTDRRVAIDEVFAKSTLDV